MQTHDDIQEICLWLQASAPGAGLSADSRKLAKGDVFFAYPGHASDGRAHIADAIAKGAAAIVYDPAMIDGRACWNQDWTLAHLAVPDLKQVAGRIANLLYARPDSGMFSVAITGTNGKTSCALWLGKAMSRQGQAAAVIGTLGVGLFTGGQGEFEETGLTTPDALLLQHKLAGLRDAGARALAIEASSIGLDQSRLSGLHVDVAVFTNLTRDHLDYHIDMDAYEAAKAKLFAWPGLKHAVINLDDAAGMRLARMLSQQSEPRIAPIGYGLGGASIDGVGFLRARDIRNRHAGTEFRLDSPFGSAQIKTRLIGHFNVSNILAVLGVLLAKGLDLRAAVEAIETLEPPPGRMQLLGGQEAPLVVIDYAHTPDALEKALAALRPVARERGGHLSCVFGCGGDRDPGKRPQMGAIAEGADHVLVTSDNPRSENPLHIIAQIVQGMKKPPQTIEDRAAAILLAIKQANKNDVVLLAGKGHEPYQEINGKRLPFSDTDHAALALAARPTMKRAS